MSEETLNWRAQLELFQKTDAKVWCDRCGQYCWHRAEEHPVTITYDPDSELTWLTFGAGTDGEFSFVVDDVTLTVAEELKEK